MSRADVTQLVQDVSNSQADSVAVERYYDDIVNELGTSEIITNAGLISASVGTAVYTLPTDGIKLLLAIYDDTNLSIESRESLDVINTEWRTEKGNPLSIIPEGEDDRSFRLYPEPDVASASFIPIFGSPVGADYPNDSIMAIYTERRDNLPIWLELPLVFEILFREFSRHSNHTDILFASMCQRLSIALFKMVL